MIDRRARDAACRMLKTVSEGPLTNWQLEEAWPKSETDPAINCILRWLWSLYDDGKETQLSACLSVEQRKIIERCQRFLETDLEFPTRTLTTAEQKAERRKWGVEWRPECTFPEDDFWPFPPS